LGQSFLATRPHGAASSARIEESDNVSAAPPSS